MQGAGSCRLPPGRDEHVPRPRVADPQAAPDPAHRRHDRGEGEEAPPRQVEAAGAAELHAGASDAGGHRAQGAALHHRSSSPRTSGARGEGRWFFEIEADFSTLGRDEFWEEMDRHCWVHPLDEHGVRHQYSSIPRRLDRLVDDVYRSLAGYVRAAGGFDKTPTAFAEFVWADFFRRSIAIEDVEADFDAAVKIALSLAQGERAKGMPGYRARPPRSSAAGTSRGSSSSR